MIQRFKAGSQVWILVSQVRGNHNSLIIEMTRIDLQNTNDLIF